MLNPTVEDVGRAFDHETMPGEDFTSEVIDDALHWTLVYTELFEFTAAVVLASERASADLSFSARVAAEIDRSLLRAHEEHYRQRCAFWFQRASDLSTRLRRGAPSLAS